MVDANISPIQVNSHSGFTIVFGRANILPFVWRRYKDAVKWP